MRPAGNRAARAPDAIHGLFRQAPVAGKLRSGDGKKRAGLSLGNHRARGDGRGGPTLSKVGDARRHRCRRSVLADASRREDALRFREEILHLLPGRSQMIQVPLEVRVGGAHQREFPPGDDEEHPLVPLGGDVDRVVGDAGQEQVNSLRRPNAAAPLIHSGQPADAIHPGPGGVHHHLRRHPGHLSALDIPHLYFPPALPLPVAAAMRVTSV
jgi:hypothetical protein